MDVLSNGTVKQVELSADEINILVQLIENAPIQGNLVSLAEFISKLLTIKEKLKNA